MKPPCIGPVRFLTAMAKTLSWPASEASIGLPGTTADVAQPLRLLAGLRVQRDDVSYNGSRAAEPAPGFPNDGTLFEERKVPILGTWQFRSGMKFPEPAVKRHVIGVQQPLEVVGQQMMLLLALFRDCGLSRGAKSHDVATSAVALYRSGRRLPLTDADLNDNPRTRDSYSFILAAGSGTFDLRRGGGPPIGDLATIEIEIGGNAPTFADDVTYVLSETEVSSGVFVATLDMGDILASAGISADDGDRSKVTYNDLMGRTARESSATLIIQRSSTAVDFSRELLPIPPEDDLSDPAPESSVGALVGTSAVTTLIVTDVRENTQSGVENTIDFDFRNDSGSPRPAFSLRVEGDGIRETIDTTAKYDGTDPSGELGDTGLFLADILPELPTLRETGRSTGMFDAELEFVNDGSLDTDEWQNLKIVFNYYNDVGDDETAGITFRGNTGVLSVDRSSVMVGNEIIVTVQDPDLNLNDADVEEFRTSLNTDGVFIVAIEPDDDEIETQHAGDLDDAMFYGILGTILGGRLGYVLFYQPWQYLAEPWRALYVWEGGMSFHGGLIGVIVAMALFARSRRQDWLAITDFIAPLVPLALGAGRLGNFINAELWGRPAQVPWAMVFPNVDELPRHPSQLYEFALEGVVLFALLWWFSSRPRPRAAVSGAFLLGYGALRFLVEFTREPDAFLGYLALGWTMGQWKEKRVSDPKAVEKAARDLDFLRLDKKAAEALPYYERLMKDFERSEYVDDARKRVAELKAPEPG